jgi:hypothetical protein
MALLDPRSDRLLAYNASAALVWQQIARDGHLKGAADALVAAYGISSDQAWLDASAIVAHWQSQGLLADGSRSARVPPRESQSDTANVPSQMAVAHRATYRIGGRAFRIVIQDRDVALRVESLFRPFRVKSGVADETFRVTVSAAGDELILTGPGKDTLRTRCCAEMTGALFQAVLTSLNPDSRWLAIIHGGSVSLDGRAALLAGTSGSGKSTLGAYLVSRGFDYLSDDMVAVNGDGRVPPWPVPLSIKDGSWSVLAPHLPQLETIPSQEMWGRTMKFLPAAQSSWDQEPNHAAALIFPKFGARVAATRMTALSPPEALRRLMSDRIWLGYPMRAESVKRFLGWLEHIPAYELSYGSFENVEDGIREAIGRG